VLRATMVKRAIDLPTFDELFDLYFSALGQAIREASSATAEAVASSEMDFAKLLEQLEEYLRGRDQKLSELAEALLRTDHGELERRIREATRQLRGGEQRPGLQEGRIGHQLALELGLGELIRELEQLEAELGGEEGMDPELAAKLRELIRRRIADISDLLKRAARLEMEMRDPERRDAARLSNLAE